MYRDISFHFVLSRGNAIATYSRVVAPWSSATWRTSSVRRSLNTTRRLVSCCPGSKVIGRSIRSTSSCITDLTAHRPRLSVCADRNEEDDSGGGHAAEQWPSCHDRHTLLDTCRRLVAFDRGVRNEFSRVG